MKQCPCAPLFWVLLLLAGYAQPSAAAQIPKQGPDLSVTTLVLEPSETVSGAQITVDVEMRNVGTQETDDAAIGYYLSADRCLGSADTLLAEDEMSDLEPGEREPESENLELPQLEPGDYYLLVAVDYKQMIRERREDNNVRAAPLRIIMGARSVERPQSAK